jgi:hypothetical protein
VEGRDALSKALEIYRRIGAPAAEVVAQALEDL